MIEFLFNVLLKLGSEWVLWILMILSVASLGIIGARWHWIRKQDNAGQAFWRKISVFVDSKPSERIELLTQEAKLHPSAESRLVQKVVGANVSPGDREKLADIIIIEEKAKFDRFIGFLGTLGANAPFIGLFGTVLGIIKAFNDLGAGADAQGVQGVSVGISEALVATAVGLFVAIPAVMAFNTFNRKIRNVMSRLESLKALLKEV